MFTQYVTICKTNTLIYRKGFDSNLSLQEVDQGHEQHGCAVGGCITRIYRVMAFYGLQDG